jgi:hypothetical protein
MTLYLPPRLAAEERERFIADVLERCADDPVATDFTRALRRVDERLMMVRARDTIEGGTPLRAGFYHVLRFNEGAPLSVFALHDNGRYIEPNSKVFERLAAGNLHDPRVFRALKDIPRLAQAEEDRQKARERSDRRDELRDRVNAATRTYISFNDDTPWSQNVQGRKRRG